MRSGTPESIRGSQDALYTCIDMGLKLLHPFMPFVTEELWQRIPKRPNERAASIMITTYPNPVRISSTRTRDCNPNSLALQSQTKAWHDENLENMVKLSQEIIRSGRSMRTDYSIKPAARVHYYLSTSLTLDVQNEANHFQTLGVRPDMIATFQNGYAEVIKTLAYASEVTLLKKGEEEPPEGCAVSIINQNCEMNLLLKVPMLTLAICSHIFCLGND
jgi:valyl-tRNA synthetase